MSRAFGLNSGRLFLASWLYVSQIQETEAFFLPASKHHVRSTTSSRENRWGGIVSSTSTSEIQRTLDEVDSEHESFLRQSPYVLESMSKDSHSDVEFEWLSNQKHEKVVARTQTGNLFDHETLDLITSALRNYPSDSFKSWSSTSQGVQRIALEDLMDNKLQIKIDDLLCNLYPALRSVFNEETLPTETVMFVREATVVAFNATQAQRSGYSGAFVPMVSQFQTIYQHVFFVIFLMSYL
jgi:hypothetical protein